MMRPMTESSSPPQLPENSAALRRRWLLGAVAGAATLGGIGLALRRHTPQPLAEKVEPSLWQQEFKTPQGERLPMDSLRGHPMVLNFWATWCPPCIAELPLLNDFFLENSSKGWKVVGLAVDQIDPVKQFLSKTPLAFPVVMAGTSGVALSKSLGNLSGGLPFTVVLGSDGLVAHRKMGKVTPNDLRAWAKLK
ncbi:MAG: hypothetical protein RL710_3163 [Pseudomonadota bacterium]